MKNYQCPICGFSISEECKYCPECGNPLFDIHSLDDEPTDTPNDNLTDTFLGTKKKGEKKEVKKHFPIGRLVFLAIAIAFGIWFKQDYDADNYKVNLHNVGYYAMTSAEHLENAGLQFIKVWQNSVNKVKDEETDKFTRTENGSGQFYNDFNDALRLVLDDKDY